MNKTIPFTLFFLMSWICSFSQSNDTRQKFRIGFDAPQIDHRQLLLTIDENTTDGFDWGYDAEIYEIFNDDMYWVIDQKKYVIQATNTISIGKEIPLGIRTVEGGTVSIGIDTIENPIDGLKVCLKDKELNIIYDIQELNYQITLPAGVYNDRYAITFLSSAVDTSTSDTTTTETDGSTTGDLIYGDSNNDTTTTGSTSEHTATESPTFNSTTSTDSIGEDFKEEITNNYENEKQKLIIYVNKRSCILNIKNKQLIKLNSVILFNRLGQNIQIWERNLNSENLTLPMNVKSGIYIVQATTENGVISKRIIINNS